MTARAAANPAAALAIGAGLAWRIAHRPPIASLLVGIGLVSLMRTSPSQKSPYMGLYGEDPPIRPYDKDNLVSGALGLFDSAKDRVQEWTGEAGDAARDTVTQIKETATSRRPECPKRRAKTATPIKDGAASAGDGVAHTAREAVTSMSDSAASVANKASSVLHDAVPDQQTRDQIFVRCGRSRGRGRRVDRNSAANPQDIAFRKFRSGGNRTARKCCNSKA